MQIITSDALESHGQASARTPAGASVMRALVAELDRHGYGELVCAMAPIFASDPWTRIGHVRGQLPQPLSECAEVFLFAGSVPAAQLQRALGPGLVDELQALGILRAVADGHVASAGLTMRRLLGLWYLHETPGPSPRMYYGDDSFALLWRQAVGHATRCLDLCCGPGIQLLHAVRQGGSGVGVEINPMAARLARINAAMNRIDSVRIEVGSLFEPISADERFDRVTANPPLLPFPDDAPYPFVGNGGEDGFAIAWPILDGLRRVLAPAGSAQIIQTCLSDGVVLAVEERLHEVAVATGLDIQVTITAHVPHHPGSPMFEGLVSSSVAGCGCDRDLVRHALARQLERHAASHLAGVFLRVVHGRGVCTIQDASGRDSTSFFFR